MNLWLAVAVALLCALAGVGLGRWFSRLPTPFWTVGYVIPVIVVFAYLLSFRIPSLLFTPPMSWALMGMKKFAALGFIATMLLTTPLSRVPQTRNRAIIMVLMAIIVFYFSIWPFLAPMMDRSELSRLITRFDKDGICLQSTDYTCGPAAAVTALRKLQLPAEEGTVAILSCTSGQMGTPLDMLADGLQSAYRQDGLAVECRAFRNVTQLEEAGLTLAVIKYGFLEDYWVTVLQVTDSEVIIGDPLAGVTRLSYDEFSRRWRFIGIILHRNPAR